MREAHASAESPASLAAHIEQKVLGVSALLRDIDNHPVEFDSGLRDQIDYALEMLAVRVRATRALLRASRGGIAA